MLAILLRTVLLSQAILGAGLGYWLANRWGIPLWTPVLLALALPFVSMALIALVSAIKSRSGEGAALWWRSLIGEFVAGVKVFVMRQPWSVRNSGILPATGLPGRIPVVLVHGFLCNHRIWDDMAQALRARGHAVLALDLEPLFVSIDRYAPVVEQAVNAMCRHANARQVALVGHSMGGLAIRAWMRAHGVQRAVRVITLGTPHAGTRVDPHTRIPNGRQMRWQSDWLTALAAAETADTRSLLRIAITAQDNVVYPQRAQTLAGLTPTVFEGIGHVEMCLHPPVVEWVVQQLESIPLIPEQPPCEP